MANENKRDFDEVGQIMAYENDELTLAETVTLFQHLIDNGHHVVPFMPELVLDVIAYFLHGLGAAPICEIVLAVVGGE